MKQLSVNILHSSALWISWGYLGWGCLDWGCLGWSLLSWVTSSGLQRDFRSCLRCWLTYSHKLLEFSTQKLVKFWQFIGIFFIYLWQEIFNGFWTTKQISCYLLVSHNISFNLWNIMYARRCLIYCFSEMKFSLTIDDFDNYRCFFVRNNLFLLYHFFNLP